MVALSLLRDMLHISIVPWRFFIVIDNYANLYYKYKAKNIFHPVFASSCTLKGLLL